MWYTGAALPPGGLLGNCLIFLFPKLVCILFFKEFIDTLDFQGHSKIHSNYYKAISSILMWYPANVILIQRTDST